MQKVYEVYMDEEKNKLKEDMEKALAQGSGPTIARFALSCLGSVPFVGGALGATSDAWSEKEQKNINKIFEAWLKLQQDEIEEIGKTLAEVMIRIDFSNNDTQERIESKEYLSLLKKCFRDWSATESERKRILIRNLLANAASCSLTSDDVIKLFIEWIDKYSDLHFEVIALTYKNQSITRYGMWQILHGGHVREDSADADLFKLVIQDLSMGHVIRQERPVDSQGNYLKTRSKSRSTSPVMKSAFDNEKDYVLTELGKQFVHYTMNEIVPKIGHSKTEN